jgi:hypothetical protein
MSTDVVIAAGVAAFFTLVLFGVVLAAWLNSQAMAVVPAKHPCGFMPPA